MAFAWRRAGFLLQNVRGGWIEDESLDRLWSAILQHKCASMQWDHAHFAWNPNFNPEGIAASSPRLRGTSNLGWEAAVAFNSNGVAAIVTAAPHVWLEIHVPTGHNLFEVEPRRTGTRGCSFLATPGFEAKSLWDLGHRSMTINEAVAS